MILKNIKYIKQITDKKKFFYLKFYFFGFLVIAILDTISIGLVPGFISIILDKNVLLEKLSFNEYTYNFLFDILNKENIIILSSIFLIFFFFLKFLLSSIFYYLEAKISNDLKIFFSSSLFKVYLNKNYLYHAINNPVILGRNISSEVNSTVFFIRTLVYYIKEIIQIILIVLLLFFANVKITFILLILFVFFAFIYLKTFSNKLKKKVAVSFHERGEKSKIIIQILNAIIEVKLHNKANFFARKFKNSIIKEFQSVKFLDFINKLPKLSMELLVVSMLCISIIIAIYLNFSIESLLPIFVLYFFAALRLYPSINGLLIHRLGIINNQISFNKVYDEFKNASASSENLNEKNNENFSFDQKILVKNLDFNYPNREKLLQDINLEIKKNETVGIIGETGSGKSTFIKILMGLIKPSNGDILIDDKNLNEIKTSFQRKIGYIPQNFYIFDDTIVKNVAFGIEDEKIDFSKIKKAIKDAQLENFINQLPDKIKTVVGPNAKKISGGQAQRLAIARALYNEPEIIVFDEATSSLDQETELEIMENINKIKKNKTIIIITHKLNLLKFCDKVFKIENQKISKVEN